MTVIRPVFAAGAAVLAASNAHAQAPSCELSANLALVSEYRGRGVTYSDEAAIQGSVDVIDSSGWSGGLWASSFDSDADADLEIDVYAAKSFTLGPTTELSLGATAYVFPGAEGWDFGEAQANIAFAAGPIDATLALNYAWEQENLGNEDNLYVSLNGVTGIGQLGGIPLSVGASIGYEEGPFAIEEKKTDWSLSLTAEVSAIEFGVSYVDTNLESEFGEAGFVFSISRTF